MPPGRKRPDVALSKVPSIGELCNRLGFQEATPIETSVFTDTTHAFRKSYKCSNGSPGSDLIGWYSIDVQKELTAMALAFLDGGNGGRFWDGTRRWKNGSDLTYPESRKIIADLLKQLFWKQNKYAYNNQAYTENKASKGRDISRDDTTPIDEAAPRISTASTSTIKPFEFEQQQTYESGSRTSWPNTRPQGPVISLLDKDRDRMADQMHNVVSNSSGPSHARDIFEFPEDNVEPARSPLISEHTSNAQPMRTPPNDAQPRNVNSPGGKKTTGNSPLAKRPKIAAKVAKNSKKKKLISPRRVSTRQKISRRVSDYAPQEMVDDLITTEYLGRSQSPAADRASGTASNYSQRSSNKVSPYDILSEYSTSHRSTFTGRSALDKSSQRVQPDVPVASMVPPSILEGVRPSRNYSIPSTISEPFTPLQHLAPPPEPSSASDPSNTTAVTKPNPKARGLFWIITSPEPNINIETWTNGQIRGRTLPDVIHDISYITHREGIEKLKIKLMTARAQTTTTVQSDAEDHWEVIKRDMGEKIREAFAADKDIQHHFQIWIEPIYGTGLRSDGGVTSSKVEEVDW